MIFGESALVSGVGAAFGLAMGIDYHCRAQVRADASWLCGCQPKRPGRARRHRPGCLTGIAGALYPAIYAMRIRPVEALRFE